MRGATITLKFVYLFMGGGGEPHYLGPLVVCLWAGHTCSTDPLHIRPTHTHTHTHNGKKEKEKKKKKKANNVCVRQSVSV